MFRPALIVAFALLATLGVANAAERPPATLYKDPQCGCCAGYAQYLRQNGFEVKVVESDDLSLIKKEAGGVPEKLEACHTMLIDRYVVEGHVPVKTLNKLLAERPDIRGISLPGMPLGAPGMGGRKTAPFTVYVIDQGNDARVYATE